MKLGWIVYSQKPSTDSSRPHGVELEDDAYGEFQLYPSEDLAIEAMGGCLSRDSSSSGREYGVAEVVA